MTPQVWKIFRAWGVFIGEQSWHGGAEDMALAPWTLCCLVVEYGCFPIQFNAIQYDCIAH